MAESLIAPAMVPVFWSMVTALDAPDASIAVPPVPVMAPVFTIAAPPANVTPLAMTMPALALIVALLLMLPEKVETLCR